LSKTLPPIREKARVGDIDEILEDWSDRQQKLAKKQEEIKAERENSFKTSRRSHKM